MFVWWWVWRRESDILKRKLYHVESVFQHRMMSPPKSYRTWWLPSHISARLVEKKKQDQLDQILQQNLWPLDALVALAGDAKQLNKLETQVQTPEELIPFLSCSTDGQWTPCASLHRRCAEVCEPVIPVDSEHTTCLVAAPISPWWRQNSSPHSQLLLDSDETFYRIYLEKVLVKMIRSFV